MADEETPETGLTVQPPSPLAEPAAALKPILSNYNPKELLAHSLEQANARADRWEAEALAWREKHHQVEIDKVRSEERLAALAKQMVQLRTRRRALSIGAAVLAFLGNVAVSLIFTSNLRLGGLVVSCLYIALAVVLFLIDQETDDGH